MIKKSKITIKDIASAAGVYPSTVSAVLSGKSYMRISDERRAHIRRIADELGYKPNRQAAGLRRSETPTIGVFLPSWSDALLYELVAGLAEGANELDLPFSFHCGLSSETYRAFIDSMTEARNTAIVTYEPFWHHDFTEIIEKLDFYRASGGKIIAVNAHTGRMAGYHPVGIDEVEGGVLAARCLKERGCRRFLGIGQQSIIYWMRLEGFQNFLAAEGFSFETVTVENVPFFRMADLVAELDRLLPEIPAEPVGIFCSNSSLSPALAAWALDRRHPIGEALQIVTYDRAPRMGEYCPLPRIIQPFYELGKATAGQLGQLLEGANPPPLLLKPVLLEPGGDALPKNNDIFSDN